MGLFGDFIEDVFSLPGQVLRGASRATAETLAATLCLPVRLVRAAQEAGCETAEEIREFVRRLEE